MTCSTLASSFADAEGREGTVRRGRTTGMARRRSARQRLTIVLAAILTALAADCGGDGSSPPSVAGAWSASFGDVSGFFGGDSATCHGTSPTILTFAQSGNGVSGSFAGGEIDCTESNGSTKVMLQTGTIANGTLNGNSISFDLSPAPGAIPIHLSGTVAITLMSGTVTYSDTAHSTSLSGVWAAEKQP